MPDQRPVAGKAFRVAIPDQIVVHGFQGNHGPSGASLHGGRDDSITGRLRIFVGMKKLSLVAIFIFVAACSPQTADSDEARSGAVDPAARQSAAGKFLGVRTVVYITPDLEAGKAWYSSVFGIDPYFDEPFYVGFQVGDFELGLDPDTTLARPGRGGSWVYWQVEDAEAAFDRLAGLGATEVAAVTDVGGGVLVGTVEDPFGNLFGIIQMP